MNRTTVMEGSLADFDLMSVMQVVSIGRQYTGLELFDETGFRVGSLSLKSGKVLAAKAGPFSGIDAVRSLLQSPPERRFFVYRAEVPREVPRPLGSVSDILMKLVDVRMGEELRTPVMEGRLRDFDLMSVLQVISLGRQLTGVDVLDGIGVLVGTVFVKSGMIVSAESRNETGVEAIRELLRTARTGSFTVHRYPSSDGVSAVCSVAQCLLAADPGDVDQSWDLTEEAPTSQRERDPGLAMAAVGQVPTPPATEPAPLSSRARSPGRLLNGPPLFDAKTSPLGMAILGVPWGVVPVVAVTSPKGGAGTTTIALNLSVVLARRGKRVVLVEADANGVLLAVNAADRFTRGAYDVMAGRASLAEALVQTKVPNLRVLPVGTVDAKSWASAPWGELFAQLSKQADIVLVDTPSGAFGPAHSVLAAATHSLLVLPAEPSSLRAFERYERDLAARLPEPPRTLGIVLNMLDYRARPSIDVLQGLCESPQAPWVFEIPIARSAAFMEATARGVPICQSDPASSPTIAWVFEMLSTAILERLGMHAPALHAEAFIA